MKLINESVWKFDSVKYGAYMALFLSCIHLVLQEVYNANVLPEPYQSIASIVLVFLATYVGRKKAQPELHEPSLSGVNSLLTVQQPTNDLAWMIEAKKHIGLREDASKTKHNPTILKWLKSLGAWWSEDETAWCGTFIAHCLKVAGVKYPKHWYRALDYVNYGAKLSKPAYGCVAIKSRKGGGHVCFVVGRDSKTGKLVCLGGNQSNMVCYALYAESEFQEFRWYGMTNRPADHRYNLPVMSGVTTTGVTEA